MKARRLIFWLALPVCLIAGLYTGLRIFYVIAFVQLLLLLLVLILNYWTLHTFRFVQELDATRAVKGGQVALSVEIANETILPMSLMECRISVASPGKLQPFSLCVPPHSETNFTLDIDLPYRGVYPIGIRDICITDIFGITSITYEMRTLPWYRMTNLTVVPRSPEAGSAGEIYDEKLFGDTGLSPMSDGESVSTARPYVEGDALKRVNWKVSARYGELYIKQYDTPARENVLILLDTSKLDPAAPVKRTRRARRVSADLTERIAAGADTVCECAATVARMSLVHGRSVQVWALGAEGAVRFSLSDEAHMDELLLWLAALPFEQPGEITGLLPDLIGQGDSLVAVSDKADSALMIELNGYAAVFESIGLIAVGEAPPGSGRIGVTSVPVGADVVDLLTKGVQPT